MRGSHCPAPEGAHAPVPGSKRFACKPPTLLLTPFQFPGCAPPPTQWQPCWHSQQQQRDVRQPGLRDAVPAADGLHARLHRGAGAGAGAAPHPVRGGKWLPLPPLAVCARHGRSPPRRLDARKTRLLPMHARSVPAPPQHTPRQQQQVWFKPQAWQALFPDNALETFAMAGALGKGERLPTSCRHWQRQQLPVGATLPQCARPPA